MPQQPTFSVENNFTKGLITESTGLNFPENAATSTDNCLYTLVGDVSRRFGIDFETNFSFKTIDRTNSAITTYKWNNAGGDGSTQIMVVQIGGFLYFYGITAATASSPLSTQFISTAIVDMTTFVASGATFDFSNECSYSDGNGYLFVFRKDCDPVYCAYSAGVVTAASIQIQVRDFAGLPDGLAVNTRPTSLNQEHTYNLANQGWITSPAWAASTAPINISGTGSYNFTVAAGLSVINGQQVVGSAPNSNGYASGTVTGYSGTILTINITSFTPPLGVPGFGTGISWYFTPTSTGYVSTWFSAEGNYPSNSDSWWRFKDSSNIFNPAVTQPQVTLSLGQAPQGHYLLPAFNLNRSAASGISGLTTQITTTRPSVGTWFQGRVWYTGVSAAFPATGDAAAYSWSENIYFSQVNVNTTRNFGACYQVNDPTSEDLFGILPTDGGVITIQGSGKIFKLFPIQNGMLVFAANGVWFITGSQGIGFSASDYTITKLSNVESISSTSFVDVMGLPYFWNEEGIYEVATQQGSSLAVNPITVGTILTFYNAIPKQSKKFVRGAYHPIDYVIQWIYKSQNDTSVTDRYSFDRILNFNVFNKAFYPYSIGSGSNCSVNGINFVQGPGGSNSPDPDFKYLSSLLTTTYNIAFADEQDETYVDWASSVPFGQTASNYVSFFVTGYKLRGQAIKKFQPQYIQMYSKTNGVASGYKIQGLWDYSNSRSSGRWSAEQVTINNLTLYDNVSRRHRIRGRGYALQFKITSVDGMAFDIAGWAIYDTVNGGV